MVSSDQYYIINKHILNFLSSNTNDQILLGLWKDKSNQTRFKSAIKKSKFPLPKRVISKYLFFCQEERQKIIKENPKMNIKEVTCELGRRWQEFQKNPEPERMKKITEQFEEDKFRYDNAKNLMEKPPKRATPKSAYLCFCEEERKKNSSITMKELGVKWQTIKETQAVEKYKQMIH